MTAAEYGANLEENLRDLHERMRSGRYIAPPVKRTWLDKDGSGKRLIGKWLKAGVLEGQKVTYPEKGTPQGAVISPLLSNIFLQHVLDDWFVREVKPRLKGRCFLIRFADDFIIGCEWEDGVDAVPKAQRWRKLNQRARLTNELAAAAWML